MTTWDLGTLIALVLMVGIWFGLWAMQKKGKPLSPEDAQKTGSEMVRGALETGIIGVSFLLPLALNAITQGKAALSPRAFTHFRAAILLLCISLMVGAINVFRLPTAVVTTDITRDRATGTLLAAQFFAVFLAILRVLVGTLYL